jgi:hypothetical protein
MQRRDLLATAGAAAAAALAGCLSSGTGSDPDGEPTGTDSPTPSPTPERGVSDSSFTVEAVGAGEVQNEATVSFDDGVTVEGTIAGRNGCYTASLAEVSYGDGTLTVRVESHERDGADVCTDAIVEVDYVATFALEGPAPTAVVVEHDSLDEVQTVAEAEP